MAKSPKPRKPRGPNKAKAPAQPSQDSGNAEYKKPAPDDVRQLVETLAAYDDQKKDIADGAKETLDAAVEERHFDKTALGWARTLYKKAVKDPEGFAVSLRHFLSYIEDLKLDQIADNSSGLSLDEKLPRISTADVEVIHSDAA